MIGFVFSLAITALTSRTILAADPPTISLGSLRREGPGSQAWGETREEIVAAISTWGFFHVTDHGVSPELERQLSKEMTLFFQASLAEKLTIKRSVNNSRGFADDELTKQRRDAKQILDIGHTPYPELADDSIENRVLDGYNQFPDPAKFPTFRSTIDQWYGNCTQLAALLTAVISETLGASAALFHDHSSFLRLNYYPLVHDFAIHDSGETTLGVSRHTDSGFLTILLHDASADGLEVYSGTRQDAGDGEWVLVRAQPGALTVNTGDMLQVWSNGRFKAPEHRVQKSVTHERYSAPFFYNPGYDTTVAPLPHTGTPLYRPINWGQFRRNRFKGDFANHGKESQIEDYLLLKSLAATGQEEL